MLASLRFRCAAPVTARTWLPRPAPGAAIVLAHLVLFAILIRHAGSPTIRDEAPPARYITLALVPAASEPEPVKVAAPRPRPAPRTRRPLPPQDTAMQSLPASVPPVTSPQEAAPQPPAPQGRGLDMVSLRADARRLAADYVPEPFEQVRDAERRLEAGKQDLGRAISSAKRPPCTKKYSGGTSMNLFALIPLAIDTITDKGCKW